jgi:hypothetical protein
MNFLIDLHRKIGGGQTRTGELRRGGIYSPF